jgi:hypothetical protein
MRFAYVSLLDPVARGIRVERENRSEPKLGQMSRFGPSWTIVFISNHLKIFGGR